MSLEGLFRRFAAWGDREALVGETGSARYDELLRDVASWRAGLARAGVGPGCAVAFAADFAPRPVALLLALWDCGAIAVPLAAEALAARDALCDIAGVAYLVEDRGEESSPPKPRTPPARPPLFDRLAAAGHPGLVLFTSGSSGRPKAVLHDGHSLLEKYQTPRPARRLLTFLLPDHIGGLNTLLSALTQGGTAVRAGDRSPEAVCAALARHRVDVLPTTPSFLNRLLLSEAYKHHDLSCLQLITYGTELMPETTLRRAQAAFPAVRFQQTYGLSELGIFRSQSRPDGSRWLRVDGPGCEFRVVDGTLRVRTPTAMLGYLNAPNPFDADGWFDTRDLVEQDGPWLRFLGRASDLLNVGGLKAHPAEVESVVLEMENVVDVAVRGEPHPLVGQCVVARVRIDRPEAAADLKVRLQRHCQARLPRPLVPVKVEVAEGDLVTPRGKKDRGRPRGDGEPRLRDDDP